MKNDSCFFDTNVLLYLLSGDYLKADRAETIIATGGVISVQVLNEFASVATRKLGLSYADIRETLTIIRAVCIIQPLTLETHELGLELAERYGFSLYDGMIVSAALQSGCTVLFTEAMQQGQKIEEKMLITNPFLDHNTP